MAVALLVAAAIALVIAFLIGTGGGGGLALAGGGALSAGAASAAAAAATNAAAAAAAAAAAGIASQIALMAGQGTPGSNQAQNKQFNDAVQSAERQLGRRLSKAERRRVHDEISGENLGYSEIVETILQMFGG